MPIYPYVCPACGHEFDALQKISDEPLTDCPACAEVGLRKRLTAPTFKLKGTGWYETDFKHGSQGSDGKKSEQGSSDGGKEDKSGASTSKESSGKEGGSSSDSATKSGDKSAGDSSAGRSRPASPAGKND